jgi:hypothetical protein
MIRGDSVPMASVKKTREKRESSSGTAEKDIFDRQFIVAALAIGVGYALILVIISNILNNPTAAGVAGVALTSLALGIFKKFETLRFKKIAAAEERPFEVPHVRLSRLILATMLCFCLTSLVPLTIAISYLIWRLRSVSLTPENAFESVAKIGFDLGYFEATHKLYAVALTGCVCLANFVFGSICARFAPRRAAYFYALVASLLTRAVPILLIGLCWVLKQALSITKPLPAYSFDDGIYSALFVATAFCGSYLTSRRREKRKDTPAPS